MNVKTQTRILNQRHKLLRRWIAERKKVIQGNKEIDFKVLVNWSTRIHWLQTENLNLQLDILKCQD
ncbi:MAG: hypothetical protein DRQ41_15265 [Gammaproteobacteria bacterium]|nr:MAG: hypothetical protein DRQ41_15265 [Gammaproteobacteria bacterium]